MLLAKRIDNASFVKGTTPVTSATPTHLGLMADTLWYKRAVFYEANVRAFSDSNGDGSGDLPGLIAKLDYLQWLGITAIWLPPFFSSPMRDGGYDVADYLGIAPEFGSIDDFRELVTRAHERNIRIVIDLVLNHTSDQHEWFKQSSADPTGPFGDFYVWRDSDQGLSEVRVIFSDFEESNWAFDPQRRQYYFHRFFSHQPDLNYENPAVHEAIFQVVRFWLNTGVDGFRLDAVPYLYASEGGNGEGEPGTHEFLKSLRKFIEREWPGRILIAEANQWPQETAAFFGTDLEPECHMAFDFPVMPRIFHALRSEQSTELVRILAEQTEVPRQASWAVFLRNHDELSLEMVSEEYRQAMYGWYAYDPRMRVNLGIRRRLAPLLNNSRSELEVVHSILLALNGTPFLYYGDEIGMGDNIWLSDRDSSRTPMQWSPDRNAGFSTADSGKLYLPIVQSLVFNHVSTNVESQLAQPNSLLHWIRNLLLIRQIHPAFSIGTLAVLHTNNLSVLAFLRDSSSAVDDGDQERLLCVFSVSARPTAVEIDLSQFGGSTLSDLFGGGHIAVVDADGLVRLTLGPQGFFWLKVN